VTVREVVVLAPVLALLLIFGVAPSLVTDRIEPSASAVIQRVDPEHRTDIGSRYAAVDFGGDL
jgi:NADH:ubiquinone oxidoreductase subunit 4 (subunit M)